MEQMGYVVIRAFRDPEGPRAVKTFPDLRSAERAERHWEREGWVVRIVGPGRTASRLAVVRRTWRRLRQSARLPIGGREAAA